MAPVQTLDIELLASEQVDIGHTFVYEVELDLDTFKRRLEAAVDMKRFNSVLPGPAPFGGLEWFLQVFVREDEAEVRLWQWVEDAGGETEPEPERAPFSVSIRLRASPDGDQWQSLATLIVPQHELPTNEQGYRIISLKIPSDQLTESDSSRLWSRRYRLDVAFVRHDDWSRGSSMTSLQGGQAASKGTPQSSVSSSPSPVVNFLTLRQSVLNSDLQWHRSPHDIKMVFPASSPSAVLWTSAEFLSALSPYFKTLLSSDFSEAVTTYVDPSGAEGGGGPTSSTGGKRDEEDSDYDCDDFLFSCASPPKVDSAGSRPYRTLFLQASYSTFRALLSFVTTQQVSFAPLCSTLSGKERDAKRTSTPSAQDSHPTSPKSLFCLGDFLDIPAVRTLAIHDFRRQLTPKIAAVELFSSTAAKHVNILACALRYVVKSWADVKDSDEMKRIRQQVKDGEIPHGGMVMTELLGS